MSSIIFEQYAVRIRGSSKSRHTLRNFWDAASRFDRFLAEEGLSAETVPMHRVEDYFYGLDLATSSKHTHLKYIRAAYNYANKRGALTHNPCVDVKLPEPPAKEPRIIPATALRAMRDSLSDDRDWVFFHLLAFTGMRRAEIKGLRWDDGGQFGSVCRLETQTLRVIGKGDKLRIVPIHPTLGEVLAEQSREPGQFVVRSKGERGVAEKTIQEMSRRLSDTYTPHDFRRTVATSLRRNGVDTSVIDRIMGWEAKSMLQRYYDNVADSELHRGILKLYADDPV